MSIEVTVDDVLDAIEKNGLEQAFGTYFEYSYGRSNSPSATYKAKAACALGQAAVNLGADNSNLTTALNQVQNLGQRIINMNDRKHRSFDEIVKYYRRRLTKAQRATKLTLKEWQYNVEGI